VLPRSRCVSTLVLGLRRPLAAVVTAQAASPEPEADPGDEFEQRVDVGEEAAFLYSKHSRALLAALYGDRCYLSDVLRSMKPFQLTDLSVACALVHRQVTSEVRWRRRRRSEHRPREAQRTRARRRRAVESPIEEEAR
jgi:hypothetical protein